MPSELYTAGPDVLCDVYCSQYRSVPMYSVCGLKISTDPENVCHSKRDLKT